MKILVLSWRGPKHPQAGGAEVVTHEHAKAWVKAGHKVVLFTSYYKGAKKQETLNGVVILRRSRQIFGVQIAVFWWYVFGSHPKFDLVIDEFHGIPFFTPLYMRVKKFAWIHEVAKEVWWLNTLPRPFNFVVGIIGVLFEPLVFKILYRNIPFMTVSESTKKDLIAWGIPTKRIAVIHNGVATLRVKARKEKNKTVIYLGAISRDKGIESALKVFDLLNREDPAWQFWVVGKSSPEMYELLISTVEKLGIKKRFKYWGWVSERKKFELLARAHVLINPSIREGWGLVNIEANSVGTPVVGYNVHGVRDSVKDKETGFLVPAKDIKSMAAKILSLSRDKEKYLAIQRKALSWSRKFNWEKSTNESKQFLAQLNK